MNLRVFLVGLVGGIMASAGMYYPLYRHLPGRIVADWPAANAGLAWGLVAVSGVLLAACGALAGRLSGASSRFGGSGAGAIAGLVAALPIQMMWGGAAAGVWGGREMLAFGLQPAASEAAFTSMLAEAVVATVWWTFASAWVAMLSGLALGAIGGLFGWAKGTPAARPMPTLWVSLSVCGALTATLSVIVLATVFSLLAAQSEQAAARAGRILTFAPQSILDWTLATHLAWLTGWLLLCWQTVRRARPETALARGTYLSAALFNGILPLLTTLFLWLVTRPRLFTPISLASLCLSIVAGLLTLREGLRLWRQPKPPKAPVVLEAPFFVSLVALSGGVILVSTLIGSAASLNIVMLLIPLITVQMPGLPSASPPAFSMASNVKANYTFQAAMASQGALLVLAAALATAVVVWAVRTLRERRQTSKTPPAEG